MKKKKLKILGLSYSHSSVGSYILVLSEIKGDRKLPIIIKPADAQFISLKTESMEVNLQRPLVHDLIRIITDSLGAQLQEIYIKEIVEGVFYPKLIFTNTIDEHEIYCTIGDAISLSIVYGCPIYASEAVLNTAGIYMSNDGKISEDQYQKNHEGRETGVSIESLQKMLENAIENDDFESAAELRDRINSMKGE